MLFRAFLKYEVQDLFEQRRQANVFCAVVRFPRCSLWEQNIQMSARTRIRGPHTAVTKVCSRGRHATTRLAIRSGLLTSGVFRGIPQCNIHSTKRHCICLSQNFCAAFGGATFILGIAYRDVGLLSEVLRRNPQCNIHSENEHGPSSLRDP